jgi:SNF2 family DNA or RNA helicase
MLDLVQHALGSCSIRYVRLDGSMPVHKREQAVSRFSTDDGVRVILISLQAGGVGLNLTAANRVYMLDPWWNPAVEEQAIDRVHRIGQTRPVIVKRCVMEDSVEGRILRLQERKRCLQGALRLNLAQDEDQRPSSLDLDDLKLIFEK